MARSVAYVVFALPVIFTVLFSTAVLVSALDTMDRELNMWPGSAHSTHHKDMWLLGKQLTNSLQPDSAHSTHHKDMEVHELMQIYSKSDAIEFWVSVSNPQYDCGTLNMQLRNDEGALVEEYSYKSQCFAGNSSPLPLEGLSFAAGEPGTYTLTITMNANDKQLSTKAVFTVE